MTRRFICAALLIAFAIAMGHYSWQTIFGPPMPLEYFVSGHGPILMGHDPAQKALYLRRNLYLSQLPRHAWLQVVGQDRVRVYLNGKLLEDELLAGYSLALIVDLTPYLIQGQNVIAIAAKQYTIGVPPAVAIEGAYELSDGEHSINADSEWRYTTEIQRKGLWWFAALFDDKTWPKPKVTHGDYRGWSIKTPPRAVKRPNAGKWITPASVDRGGNAAVRRKFHISDRPRQAWIRITSTSSYRMAVNGILVDEQEDQLDTTHPAPAVRRIYDITLLMRKGDNVVSLMLESAFGIPHLLADLEVEDWSNEFVSLGTDDNWQSQPGLPDSWLNTSNNLEAAWTPCYADPGYLNIMPWMPRREIVQYSLPLGIAVQRGLKEGTLILGIGMAAFLACTCAAWLLKRQEGKPGRSGATQYIVYSALILPTLCVAAAYLTAFDPRFLRQKLFQPLWFYLLLILVLAQWIFLGILAKWRDRGGSLTFARNKSANFLQATMLLAALVLVGFVIRLKNLDKEPIQWDEAFINEASHGVWDAGFPSFHLRDLPRMYLNTSEVLFIPDALMLFVTDNDRYICRFPSICFSTLTIILIFIVGRRMFNTSVGLVAAGIYTFSPFIIGMSDFGRYFSQLQFFTLLSLHYFWLTIRGTGPINYRALWLTAISFAIAFLTWEGVALVAPGMIVAVLLLRRGNLRTVLCDWSVWAALVAVGLVALFQYSHRLLQQTQFLYYGTSLTDVALLPMWRYPEFNLWYYVWSSTWNQDALLPMVGLVASGFLAIKHRFQNPVRFLMITHLVACWVTSLLLSVITWRYIHHMAPVLILLVAAFLVAAGKWLATLARQPETPRLWLRYARLINAVAGVGIIAFASGFTVELTQLAAFRTDGYGIRVFKFPDLEAPTQFVRDHMQDGDLVLATDPQHIDHLMRYRLGKQNWATDIWPCSDLNLPATVSDHSSVPLDRRHGTVIAPTLDSLKDLFARHDRVWYIVQPERHAIFNTAEVSIFLRQHMEVAYEDHLALVLFRQNHRTAAQRLAEELQLHAASSNYLP